MRTCIVALAALLLAGPALAGKTNKTDNWSGVYAGAHFGYGWADVSVTDTTGGVTPGPFPYSPDGGLAGATLGANLQLGNLVVGAEGELGYMDLTGEGRIPSSTPPNYQALTLDGGTYALVGGRAGLALGPVLAYGKGGWIWWDTDARQTTTKPGFVTHGTGAFQGWAYGGGLELHLVDHWSFKAEYLHLDLGVEGGDQTSITDPPTGYVYKDEHDVSVDTVKVGFNYSLGGF